MAMGLRNVSKAELGRRLKVDEKTAGNYANGSTAPSVPNLLAICDALDVSADFLLGRTDDMLGLVPGRWVVDLDEEQRPTGPRANVAFEIPERFELTSQQDAEDRTKKARDVWRALQKGEGRLDA
jgi:transcriptional regulator with XRE-family HTH domain